MKRISKIIIVELIALVFIFAFGAVYLADQKDNTSSAQTSSPQVNQPVNQPAFTVTDFQLLYDEYGNCHAEGTAVANIDMSYSEIDAQFLDSTGAVLDSSLTNVRDLKAGQTWKFKIYTMKTLSDGVSNAKITDSRYISN